MSHARAHSHYLGASILNRVSIMAKIDREESPINRRQKYPASSLSFSEECSNSLSLAPIMATIKPIIRITPRSVARAAIGHSYIPPTTASAVIKIGHQPQLPIVLNTLTSSPYRYPASGIPNPPSIHASRAFCRCILFSAWSKTTDCGLSRMPSATSSP